MGEEKGNMNVKESKKWKGKRGLLLGGTLNVDHKYD